jgi:hemolysin activation/secretion protein
MAISRIFPVVLLFVLSSVYAQQTETPAFVINQYVVEGDNPLDHDFQKLLEPYLGEHFGIDGLSAAVDEVSLALQKAGFSFHRAILPAQTLDNGTVRIQIVEFKLGKVEVEGNEYFSDQNILSSLPEIVPGEAPNNQKLSRSLEIANQHAAKSTRVSLRQGLEADTIDADISVTDRNPQALYFVLDNTGNEETEDERLTVSYQHSNLFDRDHTLTASMTTSPADTDKASQLGVSYRIPLYEHGATLDFLASASQVDSGEVADSFEISGEGTVFSALYSRPILTDGSYNHDWSIGFQDKLYENDLSFAGTPIGADVKSRPLELGYKVSNFLQSSVFNAHISFAANISGGTDNEDEDYDLVRSGAPADWSLVRFGADYSYFLENQWRFSAEINAQQSGDPLISGEQFGVGGMSSLRGFEERSLLGDSGYSIRLEAGAPPLTSADIMLVGFIDAADLELEDVQAGEEDSISVSSIGLGLRWSWRQQLSLSIDYAQINEGSDDQEDGDSKAHFSLVYRY